MFRVYLHTSFVNGGKALFRKSEIDGNGYDDDGIMA